MKPQRNKPKRSLPSKPGTRTAQAQNSTGIPISRTHRWFFRFAALTAPLLLLGVVELGLRLTDFGFPTAFFLDSRQGDRAMLIDNPKFGWRFFPPEVARTPRPLFFPARKPPGTVRVFVFGSSAAMGDPEPAYGFPRQLERILQARHPNQQVEVINTAMTAINSHVIREIAGDCRQREGDFWLLMEGNNEVIGPYGAGTVFGSQAASLPSVRLNLALKTTRLGQLLAGLTRSSREPSSWEGMELFLGYRVAQNDPRLANVYANFAANLTAIVEMGKQSGAKVLVSTVPVNLKDSPPFASLHRPDLRPDELTGWEKCYTRGMAAESAGQFENALTAYREAAQFDDTYSELAFRLARCELELNQTEQAKSNFARARDLDTLRFRTDSRLNDLIRQVAVGQGIGLIDANLEFSRPVEQIPGADLFYDHVHFTFTGNYRLARLFAEEMEGSWPGGSAPNASWLTETEVTQRLAFTQFDQRRVGALMRTRLQQPPFTAQSNFRQRDDFWRDKLAAASIPPATEIPDYRFAITQSPADWLLHANFAALLESAKDIPAATAQWEEVRRLMPNLPDGWFHLGRLAEISVTPGEAEGLFLQGLQARPDSVEMLTEYGRLLAGRGDTGGAINYFRKALRLRPAFSAARINLGLVLAQLGEFENASAQYREAIRYHTNNVEARINLANLLMTQGKTPEAILLGEEAVRLQPDSTLARCNLGRSLVTAGRVAEAIPQFTAAAKQSPNLAEIHNELGNALGRLGQNAAALEQFAEAVRLEPNLVDARFNYGVALAKTGRISEAAVQFRETLRLRPDHPLAQRFLDQATGTAPSAGPTRGGQ